MKHASLRFRSAFRAFVISGLAAQGAVRAQDLDVANTSGWFVRVGAVARFNVKASITAIPRPTGSGIYDDGFVLPDSGGTASGTTWNWGYNAASQIEDGQLVLKRFNDVPSFGQQDVNVSNPLLGGEITGGYQFSEFQMRKKSARFGVELGAGYFTFSEEMNFAPVGTASHTTATYGIGGILPPIAPYAGTATGPGPLINLNPGSSTDVRDNPGGTTTSFQGNLEAHLYNLRIGPTLEVDLSKRLSVVVGAGYAPVYADARLEYAEAVTFSNPAVPVLAPIRADLGESKWRLGFYGEIHLNFRITNHIDAFVGGDFQYNSDFTFGDSGHQVKLDLGATYGTKIGMTFRF
ncbi:MAG: hypothetical protein ABI651_02960 [Verrucomicrobiota bacterium]